jgi:hypothetical protein
LAARAVSELTKKQILTDEITGKVVRPLTAWSSW